MGPREFTELAGRLMRQPAAPGYEEFVQSAVREICLEQGFRPTEDQFGNLLIRLQTDPRQRPIALSAHMDHPGFAVRKANRGKMVVRFLGGVPDAYFRAGIHLRFIPGNLRATLGRRISKKRDFEARLATATAYQPKFAVWDLENFSVRGGRIYGRACDDLIGVAAILATLLELKRSRARCNVLGIISRAEEIGFLGALALVGNGEIPADALVVSLETSRELPPAKMGKGVIIRVGDRTTVFDSEATRYLTEVAGNLSSADKSFQWQRALMFGGTCEATAYQEFGYQTCAVCVALGNYHNCAPRGRIAAEFVSVADACGMVRLLTETVRNMKRYERLVGKLPARLRKLRGEALRTLSRSGSNLH
jgi:putative aminopeptidase FrvX